MRPKRTFVAITVVVFAIICSPLSLASAQTTQTGTVTVVTSIYSITTVMTTITTSLVSYTTTTETLNSTITGTQTKGQLSLATLTSTYTTILSGTGITTVTMTLTEVSTQTMQILGNVWGEALASVALAGAVLSYLIPKVSSTRPKGTVCKKCGNLNPPFARGFCVKCGNPVQESS